MEDRLDALGGRLTITSTPGAGTTLRASVPTVGAATAASRLGSAGGRQESGAQNAELGDPVAL
jgi:hypothetical protein